MKSAEEWDVVFSKRYDVKANPEWKTKSSMDFFRDMCQQIQLDAWKQGMTDAAEIASKKAVSYDNAGCELAAQAILTKRDNTTSLP